MPLLRRLPYGSSLAIGLACAALALAWQALTVRFNYGGNWTGLYCTGSNQRIPSDLLSERIYALPNSNGFDGQFYHYIAHDPLARTQLHNFIDAPRLRYRRILVPGLAFVLAAGSPQYIDAAYYAIVLLFVFLGGYWLSRFAVLHQRHPAWGLLFLAFPSVLTSIDRMTVDVALAAFWAGFAVYAAIGGRRRLYVLLVLAPLARETGLAIVGTYCLWVLWNKEVARAARSIAAVVPCLVWYLYLQRSLGPDTSPWAALQSQGLFAAIVHPFQYPWSTAVNMLVIAADYLALAAPLAAVILSFRLGVTRTAGVLEFAAVLQGALGSVLVLFGSRDIWVHVYGYARVLSPLFILLALRSLERRTWKDLVPLPLLMPRIGLQFGSHVLAVLRGVLSL
jgi:hypothetical protein